MYAPIYLNDSPLSKEVVRVAQQRALIQKGIHVSKINSFRPPVDSAVLDGEGLFRTTVRGSLVLQIPEAAHDLKFRLMGCSHVKETGQRGLGTTLIRLRSYCW